MDTEFDFASGSSDEPDIRDDAFEVFVAEASRRRMRDRSGSVRIRLRCGQTLVAKMGRSSSIGEVDGYLSLHDGGRDLLVAENSIGVVRGGSTTLRDESGLQPSRSLTALLRELWGSGTRVRILLDDARWLDGPIVIVASDHVALQVGDEVWTAPFTAIEAWDLGRVV